MAKFKPVRPKKAKDSPSARWPCLASFCVFVGIAILFVVMYLVLKYANG